jgi:hypothetical protein
MKWFLLMATFISPLCGDEYKVLKTGYAFDTLKLKMKQDLEVMIQDGSMFDDMEIILEELKIVTLKKGVNEIPLKKGYYKIVKKSS